MTKSSFGDAGRMALGEIDSNARLPSSEDEERRMRSKTGSTTYMAGSTPGALSAKHASRLATLRAEEDEEEQDEEEDEEEEEEESSVLLADDEFSFEFAGNVVDDVMTPGGSEDDSGTSDTLVLTSKASRLSRVHETLELFKSLATLAISPPSSSEATRAAPTPANTPAASNANVLLRRFEATETTTTTMDASSPVVVRDASMTSARNRRQRDGGDFDGAATRCVRHFDDRRGVDVLQRGVRDDGGRVRHQISTSSDDDDDETGGEAAASSRRGRRVRVQVVVPLWRKRDAFRPLFQIGRHLCVLRRLLRATSARIGTRRNGEARREDDCALALDERRVRVLRGVSRLYRGGDASFRQHDSRGDRDWRRYESKRRR